MNPSVYPARNYKYSYQSAYQNFCAEMRVKYAAQPRMRKQKKLGAMWHVLTQPQKAAYRPGAAVPAAVAVAATAPDEALRLFRATPVVMSPLEEAGYYARERRIATLKTLCDKTHKEIAELEGWNEAFRQEVRRRVATLAVAPA